MTAVCRTNVYLSLSSTNFCFQVRTTPVNPWVSPGIATAC